MTNFNSEVKHTNQEYQKKVKFNKKVNWYQNTSNTRRPKILDNKQDKLMINDSQLNMLTVNN